MQGEGKGVCPDCGSTKHINRWSAERTPELPAYCLSCVVSSVRWALSMALAKDWTKEPGYWGEAPAREDTGPGT